MLKHSAFVSGITAIETITSTTTNISSHVCCNTSKERRGVPSSFARYTNKPFFKKGLETYVRRCRRSHLIDGILHQKHVSRTPCAPRLGSAIVRSYYSATKEAPGMLTGHPFVCLFSCLNILALPLVITYFVFFSLLFTSFV